MNESEQVKMAQAVHNMMVMLPAILEHADIEARIKRGRFLSLVKAGFSESQAMQILVGEHKA